MQTPSRAKVPSNQPTAWNDVTVESPISQLCQRTPRPRLLTGLLEYHQMGETEFLQAGVREASNRVAGAAFNVEKRV